MLEVKVLYLSGHQSVAKFQIREYSTLFVGVCDVKGEPDTTENVLTNLQANEATYAVFKGPC